ncbi:CAP domain-containing protein [Methanobrevibacter curvatus]|uniref:Cysteine-rich secretory protein family protein n=1 Tax=Methanobrevibacter curvatus TaxID=49547 RepID=A0A166B195_9EURY|nr:CAP domain-containing protein [Methanobrevibacter curvatus]KZX12739.1 cysteine-rich secretory protein family protein [Methanobrevibacter curvatus]
MKFRQYLKAMVVIFFLFSVLTLTIASAEPYHGASTDDKAKEILNLVNAERAKNGIAPLALDKNLTAVGQMRANEIIYKFSHYRENGKYWTSLIDSPKKSQIDNGSAYTYSGENIASGQASARAVMADWMNSPTHRSNILDPSFTKLGVGFVYIKSDEYKYYWVQLFSNYSPSIKKQNSDLKVSSKVTTVKYKKKKYLVRTYKFINPGKTSAVSKNYKIKIPKGYKYFKSYDSKKIVAKFNKKSNLLTLYVKNLLFFNGGKNIATIKVALLKKK